MNTKHLYYHILIYLILLIQDTKTRKSYLSENNTFFYFVVSLIFINLTNLSGVFISSEFNKEKDDFDDDYEFYSLDMKVNVPIFTFYCCDCKKLIKRRYFHSYFLDTCIGINNFLFFFYFLGSSLICILVFLYDICSSVLTIEMKLNWIESHVLLLILVFPLTFFLIQISILFVQSLMIIFINGYAIQMKRKFGLEYLKLVDKKEIQFVMIYLKIFFL